MGSNRDLMWQRQFGSSWSGFGQQQPIQQVAFLRLIALTRNCPCNFLLCAQGGLSSFDSSSQQLQQPSWSDKNMFMTSNFGNLNTGVSPAALWPCAAYVCVSCHWSD